MNIIWHQNPMRTVIELGEWEKKELWYKIKIEDMTWRFHGAHMHLTDKEPNIAKAIREIDPKYLYDEQGNDIGRSGIDRRTDELHKSYLSDLIGPHLGDCTCFPMSCGKCHVEEMLGINTIDGLGKHPGHELNGAFGEDGERTIEDALERLRTYDPNRDADANSWKHKDPKTWASAVPGWKTSAKEAHDWLIQYRDKHFPETAKPRI